MTLKLMTKFGLKYKWNNDKIIIKKQKIVPYDIVVEKDWSASSFWMLICSLAIDSEILLKKLTYSELQGDSIVFRIAEHFGVKMIKKGNDILMKKIKNFNIDTNTIKVYSSPLKRCIKLTNRLTENYIIDERIKEMNLGDWEMKKMGDIPKNMLEEWENNLLAFKIPNGESNSQFLKRLNNFLEN